jgi:hypothetical protein
MLSTKYEGERDRNRSPQMGVQLKGMGSVEDLENDPDFPETFPLVRALM